MKYNPKSLKNLDQTRHGMCGTPTWSSWARMIRRCTPGNDKAKWYADRGIKVCERWKTFESFLADMGKRPNGKTLDRINVDGNYEPTNCRWATKHEQMRNKRTNVNLTFGGRTQCLAQWAAELGISRETIKQRLSKGWPMTKVLTSKRFFEQSGRWGHR